MPQSYTCLGVLMHRTLSEAFSMWIHEFLKISKSNQSWDKNSSCPLLSAIPFPSVMLPLLQCWWVDCRKSAKLQQLLLQCSGCCLTHESSWWVRPVQTESFAITLLTQLSLELRHKGHSGEAEPKGLCVGLPITARESLRGMSSYVEVLQHSTGSLWGSQRQGDFTF